MSHRLNKSHLIICVIAALVIVVGIVVHYRLDGLAFPNNSNNSDYFVMALWVSLVIVVFYIVGHIARYVLLTGVYPPQEEMPEEAVTELELADEMPMGIMEPIELTEITVEPDDDFDADIMYDEHMEGDLIENIALDAS